MSVAIHEELHARRGAELSQVDGALVALHYGDVEREVEAARRGVGLLHRSWRALMRVEGEKRTDFLQAMVSNDVAGVEAGDGCRTLFLDTKGHIVGDLDFWRDERVNVLAVAAGAADDVLAGLRKYVLAAPVSFEDRRDEDVVVAVLGPRAGDLLKDVGVELPPEGARPHVAGELAGVAVRVARTPSLAAPGFEIHLPASALEAAWETLESGAPEPLPVGWQASEVLRVEAGIPGHAHELTGDEFPQEARLDEAVDYEKGCYLGQETVARIHYRGQVNRLLAGLRLPEAAGAGAVLEAEGRQAGSVTSAVDSSAHGRIGLGYVRRERIEAGTRLQVVADGEAIGEAIVEALPFTTSDA